jgi:peptide/nickel transport system permease protein
MVVLLFAVSIIAFIVIQLPPGDFLTSYVMSLRLAGEEVSDAEVASLERIYGLNLPWYAQYAKWVGNMLRGDFGLSFYWNKPVASLLAERIPLTIAISLSTLVFIYVVGIAIGVYSATHQYSIGDYTFTTLGFIGLAIPNFLLALILMFILFKYFNMSAGGLFSPEFSNAPWSLARVWDLMKHLPVPIIVIGTAGTARIVRVMRGCTLDELRKQYVVTARSKGVKETTLLFRYPVRVAINPIVSRIGWELPAIISGATITAIVLNLPTTGPMLYQALLSQDMYLAGSTIMILSFLTMVGTLLSDIMLAWLDPRIRFERRG